MKQKEHYCFINTNHTSNHFEISFKLSYFFLVLIVKCKPKGQVASKKKGNLGKIQGYPKCSFKRLLLSNSRKRENGAACSLMHHGGPWSLWAAAGRENFTQALHAPQPVPGKFFLSSRSAQPPVNGIDKYFLCHSLFTNNFFSPCFSTLLPTHSVNSSFLKKCSEFSQPETHPTSTVWTASVAWSVWVQRKTHSDGLPKGSTIFTSIS